MAKRVYTPEQLEARRLWQIEWRKKNNYDSWRKYYPKTKEKRQIIASQSKVYKLPKQPIVKPKKEAVVKISKQKPVKIKKIAIKEFKPKYVEKKFTTLKKDLSTMKRIYIKELRLNIFISHDKNENDVILKYLNKKA